MNIQTHTFGSYVAHIDVIHQVGLLVEPSPEMDIPTPESITEPDGSSASVTSMHHAQWNDATRWLHSHGYYVVFDEDAREHMPDGRGSSPRARRRRGRPDGAHRRILGCPPGLLLDGGAHDLADVRVKRDHSRGE